MPLSHYWNATMPTLNRHIDHFGAVRAYRRAACHRRRKTPES